MKLKYAIPLTVLCCVVLLLILYAFGLIEIKFPESKKDFNYSGYVEEQPEVLLDYQIFINRIKSGFNTKLLFENFGQGEHNFLFEMKIGDENNVVDFNLIKRRDPKTIPVDYLMDKDKIEKILKSIPIESGKTRGKNVDGKLIIPISVTLGENGVVTNDWHVGFKPFVSENKNNGDEPYTYVEQMPVFPGGQDKLIGWMMKNIKYPEAAKNAGIEGRVMVSFIIEKSGDLSGITVLKGIGGGCDEEALRVMRLMPKWEPGKQGGKTVRVRMVLPFMFKLQ